MRPQARLFSLPVLLVSIAAMFIGLGSVSPTITRADGPCGSNGVYSGGNTCTYTAGGTDTFTVPAGVSTINMVLVGGKGGAGGGNFTGQAPGAGGFGARAVADKATTPGSVFDLVVATNGTNGGS